MINYFDHGLQATTATRGQQRPSPADTHSDPCLVDTLITGLQPTERTACQVRVRRVVPAPAGGP